ncbi:MAG: hypothetical protein A2664_00285 [Candidatus Taylorbacteria bacterium RIFCSPHIGHO2_01_FULL_46_22b]|uniref:Uncharacterized protein n=1 Tax=Candidatus Taylorbacteria bacterium RIFCSPHIGHO2_01_FULL_46_22b TaxID=1802301 RepID=A0A1G2M6G9_9BACT|nr:MAG: hypothetical protein A2664_00285 [Candidatus Taylorbacteria bacterium RIFCSPHIGHO2_01_FULL_46_22b]
MILSPDRVREILASTGAVIEGHFVGTSGKHLSLYVAKDRATRLTSVSFELCLEIARRFAQEDVDVVVAPAVGAIALSQWTAYHLSQLRPDRPEVLALYSEHLETIEAQCEPGSKPVVIKLPWHKHDDATDVLRLFPGEKLVVVKTSFVLKRGFAADVKGKRVLAVEDTLTTGLSARGTADAIKAAGGILVGVGALVEGGGVTADDLGVFRLESLLRVKRQIFTREECADHGLCRAGVPINTQFGHGAAFLAEQGKS